MSVLIVPTEPNLEKNILKISEMELVTLQIGIVFLSANYVKKTSTQKICENKKVSFLFYFEK